MVSIKKEIKKKLGLQIESWKKTKDKSKSGSDETSQYDITKETIQQDIQKKNINKFHKIMPFYKHADNLDRLMKWVDKTAKPNKLTASQIETIKTLFEIAILIDADENNKNYKEYETTLKDRKNNIEINDKFRKNIASEIVWYIIKIVEGSSTRIVAITENLRRILPSVRQVRKAVSVYKSMEDKDKDQFIYIYKKNGNDNEKLRATYKYNPEKTFVENIELIINGKKKHGIVLTDDTCVKIKRKNSTPDQIIGEYNWSELKTEAELKKLTDSIRDIPHIKVTLSIPEITQSASEDKKPGEGHNQGAQPATTDPPKPIVNPTAEGGNPGAQSPPSEPPKPTGNPTDEGGNQGDDPPSADPPKPVGNPAMETSTPISDEHDDEQDDEHDEPPKDTDKPPEANPPPNKSVTPPNKPPAASCNVTVKITSRDSGKEGKIKYDSIPDDPLLVPEIITKESNNLSSFFKDPAPELQILILSYSHTQIQDSLLMPYETFSRSVKNLCTSSSEKSPTKKNAITANYLLPTIIKLTCNLKNPTKSFDSMIYWTGNKNLNETQLSSLIAKIKEIRAEADTKFEYEIKQADHVIRVEYDNIKSGVEGYIAKDNKHKILNITEVYRKLVITITNQSGIKENWSFDTDPWIVYNIPKIISDDQKNIKKIDSNLEPKLFESNKPDKLVTHKDIVDYFKRHTPAPVTNLVYTLATLTVFTVQLANGEKKVFNYWARGTGSGDYESVFTQITELTKHSQTSNTEYKIDNKNLNYKHDKIVDALKNLISLNGAHAKIDIHEITPKITIQLKFINGEVEDNLFYYDKLDENATCNREFSEYLQNLEFTNDLDQGYAEQYITRYSLCSTPNEKFMSNKVIKVVKNCPSTSETVRLNVYFTFVVKFVPSNKVYTVPILYLYELETEAQAKKKINDSLCDFQNTNNITFAPEVDTKNYTYTELNKNLYSMVLANLKKRSFKVQVNDMVTVTYDSGIHKSKHSKELILTTEYIAELRKELSSAYPESKSMKLSIMPINPASKKGAVATEEGQLLNTSGFDKKLNDMATDNAALTISPCFNVHLYPQGKQPPTAIATQVTAPHDTSLDLLINAIISKHNLKKTKSSDYCVGIGKEDDEQHPETMHKNNVKIKKLCKGKEITSDTIFIVCLKSEIKR
ncbi:MAG: hypothetical protein NkDv07_0488 [Candidatus Improbicoccus devescovinae]|nr:MAG: hypothetical protein NkDv07_0488 [Candidatus Improbicoccus devescovinae]